MTELRGCQRQSITVQELCASNSLDLDLEVVYGKEEMSNKIGSPRIQKLGFALAGYNSYVDPDRIQLLGRSEINFLRNLQPRARGEAIGRLRGLGICCLVITRGLRVPKEVVALAKHDRIALLKSSATSFVAITKITRFLNGWFAPRITIHGVLLDVFGLGILLLGPSGIGKSECALELILKGHRLIADDAVDITRHGDDRLVGSGGQVLQHHMELRGLGIINVRELFGISATGVSRNLDLVVRLERWKPDAEYDRLGLEQSFIEYMGVPVPLIEVPVAPGRNLSALVEIAARIHLLRRKSNRLSTSI
ncbi:MAG: hprK [Acidobacteria bacterium]|nr:hprK [Acidobacteriota bacterium]